MNTDLRKWMITRVTVTKEVCTITESLMIDRNKSVCLEMLDEFTAIKIAWIPFSSGAHGVKDSGNSEWYEGA